MKQFATKINKKLLIAGCLILLVGYFASQRLFLTSITPPLPVGETMIWYEDCVSGELVLYKSRYLNGQKLIFCLGKIEVLGSDGKNIFYNDVSIKN